MIQTATDAIRYDQSALLAELQQAGANVRQPNQIHCPFHDDAHPSSGVYNDDNGVCRFKCHGCGFCGDLYDVRAKATGRDLNDVLRETKPDARPVSTKPAYATVDDLVATIRKVESVYRYTNPKTKNLDLGVIRYRGKTPKDFLQFQQTPRGFMLGAPPKPWPLYNRTRLANASTVVIVEGEKCVHALHNAGYVATTSPGGAGKAKYADWSPLAGKRVFLWPDNDPVDDNGIRKGLAHMRDVERILGTLDPPVETYWIDPDGLNLPPKGDVVDLLEQHDPEDRPMIVEALLAEAEPRGASCEVKSLIEDMIDGKRKAIDWPWTMMSRLTKALLPGTVMVLCGDPGSAKSFMLLQASAFWHDQGVKVALLELEEDRKYHLHRALAQRAGKAAMFDDAWVRDNPDEAMTLFDLHRNFLDTFGRCIHEAPDEQMTLNGVADWIDRMAMAGNRVIAVDPVTMAEPTDKPWIEDQRFMGRVKTTVRQFDASLILVTHPKKGAGGKALLENVASGAAYTRFSQTVVWLSHHEPPKELTVRSPSERGGCTEFVMADRVLKLSKTRNSNGGGIELAFDFAGKALRFQELGAVIKDK